jgi:lipopolysaccharide/colanic/teichoic acid biosynthesis glycosyltransferase
LDELPELWNVLKGEMSLVGPRPEVPRYVDLEDERWRRILRARPGLTDTVTLRLRNEENLLAAVKGDRQGFYSRMLQPYKLNGYVEFLETRTWRSDLKVLGATVLAVLRPSRVPPPTLDELAATIARRTRSSATNLSLQPKSARPVAHSPGRGSDSHG